MTDNGQLETVDASGGQPVLKEVREHADRQRNKHVGEKFGLGHRRARYVVIVHFCGYISQALQ